MAKGGGGAWKVAYADFVTAMMAFFLVMWICGQDQKLRRAVSHYFNAPFDTSMIGNSKKPSRTGSISDANHSGSVPMADSVAMGQGRDSHTDPGTPSGPTKALSDWLTGDKKTREYWWEQAAQARSAAAKTKEVKEKSESADQVAAYQLSVQLRDEVVRNIPHQVQGAYRDLLFEALAKVNWTQLAEDLLGQ